MKFVSDFADQAVMLPLALVVLAVLGILGWRRGLVAWSLAIGFTFGLILILKAGFVMLTSSFGSDYRISPSGHVASACVVYGGLAVLLLRDTVLRYMAAAVPAATILVMGYSRVSLGMHTVPEVVAGAVVGIAGVSILAATMGPRPSFAIWPVPAIGGMLVLALHGLHLPAEEAIHLASYTW